MNRSFKQTIRLMSAKQIIMAMVNGLKKEHVKVNMEYYGFYNTEGICFGCAATNTICEISGKVFDKECIDETYKRAEFIDISWYFLNEFESIIDNLRSGSIYLYNYHAKDLGIAQIKFNNEFELPVLTTETYLQNLHIYEKLAELQD